MKFTRTSIAAFAVAALLSGGCYDDPLDEGRGDATVIEVNRAESFLTVGKPFTITAKAIDGQLTPMPVTLSATAGSGLTITSTTYVEELRETRFVVMPTAVIDGAPSTVTITGEGLSKTVEIYAYPKAIQVNVASELQSGATATPTVTGLDQADASLGDVGFEVESDDESIVEIGEGGVLIAKGVGKATLTFTGPGGVITKELDVTVVPGTFTGTVSNAAVGPGGLLTFTAGTVPFDDDTEVVFSDADMDTPFIVTRNATTLSVIVPHGIANNEAILQKVGPSQLALRTTFNASATGDPGEPDDSEATARALPLGTAIYGVVGNSDVDDIYKLVVTTAGSYHVVLDWTDGSDIDAYMLLPGGALTACSADQLGCGMLTGDQPEIGDTGTLAPGTYYLFVEMYDADGSQAQYKLTVTRN